MNRKTKPSEAKRPAAAGREKDIAMRVSAVSILVNTVLSAGKLLAGIFAKSGAMISDAVHSASDVFSTLVVIVGIRLSKKKSDREHPYGHERLECVASILLAAVLAATGMGIGLAGARKVFGNSDAALVVPGLPALLAAVVSVGVKEWMYWYTRAAARKLRSGALMADAWHHRSDALSSVGAFAGILGARLGFPVLDPIASLLICIFIEKAAFQVFRDAVDKMVDKACAEEDVARMKAVILSQPGVEGIDEIKTRLFGSRSYVDVEISVAALKTLLEAHETAERVHRAIEEGFSNVKHCMVHVNPKLPEEPAAEPAGEAEEAEDCPMRSE